MNSHLYNQESALSRMFAGGQTLAYNHGGPVLSQMTLRHFHGRLSGSGIGFTPLSRASHHSTIAAYPSITMIREHIIITSTFKFGA
jgi:hypothetical protein